MTRAWLAFVAVVVIVLNAGVSHDTERALTAPDHALSAGDAFDGVRLLYTDSADPRRYFAYANAVLGRPCSGYYVRSADAWREEFAAGIARDPDLVPDVTPAHPLVPYRDFAVEYPPLLFSLVVPLAAVIGDADAFRVAFGVEMALVLALAVLLAVRLARRVAPAVVAPRIVGWTALAALLLGGIVTHRFDAVVALALVATLVAMVEDRPAWTGALLGVAIGLKLVPLVIGPILALRWVAVRRWGAIARGAVAATLAVVVTLGPLALLDSGGLGALLHYHATRPLQVESTWAAGLRVLALVDGSRVDVVRSYGSINATGDHAAAALVLSTLLLIAGLGAVIALTWRKLARAAAEPERLLILVRGAVAALVVMMAAGKVFSPQYLIWLLPLAVPIALVDGRRSLAVLAGILLATQVIYPIGNVALQHGDAWVSVLVLARNLTLLTWALRPLAAR